MGEKENISEKMESPEFVRLSLAADMSLGFRRGLFWRNARMTCINLLLTYADGCQARCSYCGLERKRAGGAKSFIRVPWPTRGLDEVIERINANRIARRICVSLTTHERAVGDSLYVVGELRKRTNLPISCLISPTVTKERDLSLFKEAGADKIGVAFDLATEELFDVHRGCKRKGPHRWETYWARFEQSVSIFGDKNVGSHFIVGLGETEEELVGVFQQVRDLGGENHLFSFFPEEGTDLENISMPPLDVYRRIQIASYIIDEGISSYENFAFESNSGKIVDYGISKTRLEEIIDSGVPFMTRGCAGADGRVACNRPFANSLPGPELRNYPFMPTSGDIKIIREQLCSSEVIR